MKLPFQLFISISLIISQVPLAEEITGSQRQQVSAIQQGMRKDLGEGRIEEARGTLEQAAGNFHSVEIELGLIQTLMQAGEYRHALSAAAHTQAEHPDVIDTSLLYAWLLAIGGQKAPAMQLLQSGIEQYPENKELKTMLLQIKIQHLDSSLISTSADIQLRPFVSSTFAQPALRHLTNGVLINDSTVITTFFDDAKTKRIRVRNGLGQTVDAQVEQVFPKQNFAVLVLKGVIHRVQLPAIAAKTPFPGNFVYVIGYSRNHLDRSDWPQLRVDVLGIPNGVAPNYPLHLQDITAGSGVYDRSGQLVGVVIKEGAGTYAMSPVDGIPADNKATIKVAESNKKSMDEIFESTLSNTVQVLIDDE